MAAFLALFFASGCASLMKNVTRPMLDNLINSAMKQQDPELVREGAPAYLLMIDGFIEGSPKDPDILSAAAQLYSAYVSAFLVDKNPGRARLMSEKARDYAFRAMFIENKQFAALWDKPFQEFLPVVKTIKAEDKKLLFQVISTWATYIQTHREDWNNIADVSKVEALTRRLLEIDETYFYGSGHLYIGVLETLLPAELGGKTEDAKAHFERAIEISGGKFLQAQVMYAQCYAKLVYDRPLHDRLLKQVLDTPADVVPELTLVNTLAKERAEHLLAEADDYF